MPACGAVPGWDLTSLGSELLVNLILESGDLWDTRAGRIKGVARSQVWAGQCIIVVAPSQAKLPLTLTCCRNLAGVASNSELRFTWSLGGLTCGVFIAPLDLPYEADMGDRDCVSHYSTVRGLLSSCDDDDHVLFRCWCCTCCRVMGIGNWISYFTCQPLGFISPWGTEGYLFCRFLFDVLDSVLEKWDLY